MSLPTFSTQSELFSTAGLSATLFAPTDRYRLFAKEIYPHLAGARDTLAKCYCEDNGRAAIEPVLMLGVSILQDIDGVPDRQAVELLRYHAGWNFALNRQLGDEVFHPTVLVKFRNRLIEHQQSGVAFKAILEALEQAGLIHRQNRQRLDSTAMFGRVAKMSRLDCVRETMRLALQELEEVLAEGGRPVFWVGLWERYVESQVDYRANAETLGRKLGEAGSDAWQLLEWLGQAGQEDAAKGPQVTLLRRVFGEQFEVVAGETAPVAKEKEPVAVAEDGESSEAQGSEGPGPNEPAGPEGVGGSPPSKPSEQGTEDQREFTAEGLKPAPEIVRRGKGELASKRVQNPHDPDATYGTKGKSGQKKEHVGYKVQVAESVNQGPLAQGEPTRNFITGIVVQTAYESDELGAQKMEQEQARMGLEKPLEEYVDGAYISAEGLARALREGAN